MIIDMLFEVLTGRDNVPVDCTRHRLMTHLFTQVKLLKKLQKLAGEVLVALGVPQGDSWAPRAKFFALEPSNWTPASFSILYLMTALVQVILHVYSLSFSPFFSESV